MELGPQWGYELQQDGKEGTLRLPVRKVFADEACFQYFHAVAADEATPTRSAWNAKSGHGGRL
ncbi:MAG: hypothetical protein H6R26_1610 [Proteobacteria bacterium]|jgi:hypothetical protein|nr:hypothetical protein [Pseudomonadota bacterium]